MTPSNIKLFQEVQGENYTREVIIEPFIYLNFIEKWVHYTRKNMVNCINIEFHCVDFSGLPEEVELKPDIDHLRYALPARKRKRTKNSSKAASNPGNSKKRKTKHKIEEDEELEEFGDEEVDDEEMELNEDDLGDGENHPCDKCKYVGRSKLHLQRHLRNQHLKPCKKKP